MVSAFRGEIDIKTVLQNVLSNISPVLCGAVPVKLAQVLEVRSHRKHFTR